MVHRFRAGVYIDEDSGLLYLAKDHRLRSRLNFGIIKKTAPDLNHRPDEIIKNLPAFINNSLWEPQELAERFISDIIMLTIRGVNE